MKIMQDIQACVDSRCQVRRSSTGHRCPCRRRTTRRAQMLQCPWRPACRVCCLHVRFPARQSCFLSVSVSLCVFGDIKNRDTSTMAGAESQASGGDAAGANGAAENVTCTDECELHISRMCVPAVCVWHQGFSLGPGALRTPRPGDTFLMGQKVSVECRSGFGVVARTQSP